MSAWPYKVIDVAEIRDLEATLNQLVADGFEIETVHLTSHNMYAPVHALIVARDTLPRAAVRRGRTVADAQVGSRSLARRAPIEAGAHQGPPTPPPRRSRRSWR
jgi:hypothetical protein